MGRKVERVSRGKVGANPLMPGLRIREDGWTEARTRVFLAMLAQTGCVTDAARVAGVSTTSVTRSRRLFPAFDRACTDARAKALRGLEAVAYERAVAGRATVIIRDGKEVERRITPSDSMLRLLIQRGDLTGAGQGQVQDGRKMTAAEIEAFVLPEAVRHNFLSREEYYRGILFDGQRGTGKCERPTPDETDTFILRQIAVIERSRARTEGDAGRCYACKQPLNEAGRVLIEAKANEPLPPEAPVRRATPRRIMD